jgi:hypothetical protein
MSAAERRGQSWSPKVEGLEATDPGLPLTLTKQLEQRDERILALELLLVDQASRLLAVEAILANMTEVAHVSPTSVHERVSSEGKRFLNHFDSITGFVERARTVAGQLLQAAAKRSMNKVR